MPYQKYSHIYEYVNDLNVFSNGRFSHFDELKLMSLGVFENTSQPFCADFRAKHNIEDCA